MNRILLIAKREWKERIRQRSFRIATLINLIVVLVAASIPTAIAYFQDDSPDSTRVAVVDSANIGAVALLRSALMTGTDADTIEIVGASFDPAASAEQVESGAVDAVLVLDRDEAGQLVFSYMNEDGDLNSTAQRVSAAVAAISFADRLEQAGIPADAIATASTVPNFNIASSSGAIGANDSDGVGGPELFVAFLIAIVMFMAIQLYGNWIAQGVVEEKANRIMEIMVNAATPRDLLAGKVLGIGLAALTQLVPMLLVGGLAFAMQPRIGDSLDIGTAASFGNIDFSALSFTAIAGFLVYFVFGFILYASLYAGVASMLSRQEDISSAVGPLMMFMMIGYISAFVTLPVADSLFARIVSIVPLTSPFTMAGRMVTTDVPAWEVGLSVALLVASAILGLFIASRIYRIGVLLYGQKPSFREVFKNRNMLGTSR
jgi:ABC-2 type transport system permease protein